MSDTTETVETENNEQTEIQETESQEVEAQESIDQVEDPAAGLKSALQKERQARKAAEKRERDLARQIEDAGKSADEKAIDEARREAAAEAMATANRRLIAAEFRSVAAKRVKDPRIAVKLVDLEGIEVDDDGNVDTDGINAALDDLLDEYPDLAPSRFEGTADQGNVNKASEPPQLTQDQLKSMSAEQINEARKKGQLDKLLGVSR